MKNLLKYVLILSFLPGIVAAQLTYIPINVDYATFLGQNDKMFTEIYLAFYQRDLTYTQNDSGYTAKFSHRIKIMMKDSVIIDHTRKYKNTVPLGSQVQLNQFIDVFPIELDPGKYVLTASVIDENSNKTGEFILDMAIEDHSSKFNMSQIEFSTKINTQGDGSNFSLKNNIHILPNPSRIYNVFNPVLYFYFEGYSLKLDENGNNQYKYHYYISDFDGKRLRNYPEKQKSTATTTIAEANGINVIALPSDNYILTVELTDLNSGESLINRKKFSVNKPDRKDSEQIIAAKIGGYEEYSGFTSIQLMDEFNKVKYIASRSEVDVFENIQETEGMKKFLSEFWKRRDTNKESPQNEFKQLYFSNLQYVNSRYSTNLKEGWRTDRGRVVLIYGQPDEIERFPSTLNTQPYEIWYYYSLEGGSEFVFADMTGNGNYELLHSTYRTEIKDPDWQLRVGKVRTREYESSFDGF